MYTTLKNIRLGQLVNIIGIVTVISEPSRTKTGGMYQLISRKCGPSYQAALRLDAFCPHR